MTTDTGSEKLTSILVTEADEVMIDNFGVQVIGEDEVTIEETGVEITEHPLSRVFRNHVLMDLICKVADMDTIKKMRLVNEFWSAIATKQLLKRSIVVLETRKRSVEELQRFFAETEQLKGIKRLCIPVLSPVLESEHIPASISEVHLFSDILNFLAPSLEFLELYLTFDIFALFMSGFFPATIRLSKLNKLILSHSWYLYSKRSYTEHFYANAPNLQEMVLDSLGNPNEGKFVLSLLQRKEDLSRNLSMLPSLDSLSLKSPLTPESIQGLVNFPQKWKKLEMVWASTWSRKSVEVADHLGKLLALNKDSLVSLKLKEIQDTGEWRVPVINFRATFSKLEHLELTFVAQPGPKVDPYLEFKSHINFGADRSVKYYKLFPRLKTFRLSIKSFTNSVALEDVCKTLFPKQVCESLQLLELDIGAFCLDYLKDQMKDENWIAKMFPNSVSKIL